MDKIFINMVCVVFTLLLLQVSAQAQQSALENPDKVEEVKETKDKAENKLKDETEKKAKSRGFDPCLVNPKLPACKNNP